MHTTQNSNKNSTYKPVNGSVVKKFSYMKYSSSTRSVTIKDYYDSAKGDYSGLAGIAINALYNAQQNGNIVPYNVEILRFYNLSY